MDFKWDLDPHLCGITASTTAEILLENRTFLDLKFRGQFNSKEAVVYFN